MSYRTYFIPPVMGQFGNQAFMYRYCVNPAGCQANAQNVEQWARTRTATTEVTLFNNANWTY
jgi:hypothetical protein